MPVVSSEGVSGFLRFYRRRGCLFKAEGLRIITSPQYRSRWWTYNVKPSGAGPRGLEDGRAPGNRPAGRSRWREL